ncbi:kelch-like protein 3 [Pocillopora damicornis]|uniref:kelch-like protein 3 n=1 Tax=Pocillopora damicornis TaxID=46731 RepID=UPI000F551B4A|nr:kelch-like protein 3 [Pocillopora damicornis]
MVVNNSETLLYKCAQFRDEEQFIDVRLKVGEDIFAAHRIVLAANSDYFYAMFTDGMREASQEVIELKDESISPDILMIILDSIYTGEPHLNEDNVFEVLAAADHLQVTSVVQQCCDFLLTEFVKLRFDFGQFCRIWKIADSHGLKDLQEAAEYKIAKMYKDVCESEEFLTYIEVDQLFSLLSRDDLSAPTETFIFKSVMQWIKHKKEERMEVAAKIIGAVRLGLVNIREVVIEELKTEEMQRFPEVNMHLQESMMHHCMPSHEFAAEKMKPRSMSPVRIEIPEVAFAQYFDVDTKLWKPLASVAQLDETTGVFCSAELIGSYLFVVTGVQVELEMQVACVVYRYHILNNKWEKLPYLKIRESFDPWNTRGKICVCSVSEYLYVITLSNPPQRYSLSTGVWQAGEELNFVKNVQRDKERFESVAATVMNCKIYVIHGYQAADDRMWVNKPAVVHCFDPEKNEWERKASTCHPHFGSSIFVVNNRLCVAGGSSRNRSGAQVVELYDKRNDTWSVVEQKHIPKNNLGAFEIERRVYFLINNFPIDSGIRIPPEENYPVHLGDEWKNLAQVSEEAVLCYLPVKKENLR